MFTFVKQPVRLMVLAMGCAAVLAAAVPAVGLAKDTGAQRRSAWPESMAAASPERDVRRRGGQETRPARDARSSEVVPQRPDEAEPPRQEFRRSGQLSPDERRALRREIDDLGRDVYQTPRGKR